ncbi:hypothetical protein JR316_0011242 [Psilocybe cubensis]|uniref:Uncharacterized protein n=1 Tax=Psilocybe cubensis TaxID=181762 RepID=A0ACB8GJ02_PSICU|nr:hypothetical protein JR316_0011242 [Psilocybe cubensis]KAH9475683.1 hypothetical protein JR316_0011242 [Psilocybe cubensis]
MDLKRQKRHKVTHSSTRSIPVEQIPTMESKPHDARRWVDVRKTRPAGREKRTRAQSPTEQIQDRLPKRRKSLEIWLENNSLRGWERMRSKPSRDAPTRRKPIQGHRSDNDEKFRLPQEISSNSPI